MNPIASIICLTFAVQSILPVGLPLHQLNLPPQVLRLDPSPKAHDSIFYKIESAELGINSPKHLRSSLPALPAGRRSSVSAGLIDKFGAATTTIDALNRQTTIVRDTNSNPTQITRPNSSLVNMTYDTKGNLLTSTENAISATTTFTYEPNFNQVKTITDPKNNLTTINYDSTGNPIEIIDSLLTKTKMFYADTNCPGQVTSITSAFGLPEANTTSFQYDFVTCNLTKTIDPLLKETTLTYDTKGNVATSTDGEGKLITFTYDSMNRLTQFKDHDNGLTTSTYDTEGNLLSIKDAKNNTTTFAYDELNRLKNSTDPLNRTETFTYDNNSNLIQTKDRRLQTIDFEYDQVNQLKKKTLPGLLVTNYTYNNNGDLVTVVDPDSSLTFTYDLLSRLTTSSTSGSPTQPNVLISYTYDKNGNRKTMNDGAGTTTYVYDNLNRLDNMTNPSGVFLDFQYDVLSRRKKLIYPNNTTVDYSYDAASQLTAISHQLSAVPFSSFSYSLYDNVGNRKTVDVVRTAVPNITPQLNYFYDNLHRLTQAIRPLVGQPNETFQYDSVGNRLRRDGELTDSIIGVGNRLLDDKTFTYSYDDNGNLISKTNKTTLQTTTYTYDAENQLIRIDFPGGGFAQYRYDGLGRRIEKDVNGIKTRYVYDNEDILFEYDGLNVLQARYTHGLGIDEPLVMERDLDSSGTFITTERFFYHTDGLGSITDITDNTGNVVRSYVYDSFGNIVHQSGTLLNSYTYTGRELDEESGLYYYRTRFYDSKIGRFINEDSIGLNGEDINLFQYVKSNPVNYIDPSGEIVLAPIIIGAVIGGGLELISQLIERNNDPCNVQGLDFFAIAREAAIGATLGGGLQIVGRTRKVGQFLQSIFKNFDIKFGRGFRLGVGKVTPKDVTKAKNILGLRKFPGNEKRKVIRFGLPGKGSKIDIFDLGPFD